MCGFEILKYWKLAPTNKHGSISNSTEEDHQIINRLDTYSAVCRTAQSTPGLWTIHVRLAWIVAMNNINPLYGPVQCIIPTSLPYRVRMEPFRQTILHSMAVYWPIKAHSFNTSRGAIPAKGWTVMPYVMALWRFYVLCKSWLTTRGCSTNTVVINL